MEMKVGSTYKITHSRKGTFVAKIISVGEFIGAEIIAGRTSEINEHNRSGVGEKTTFRASFVVKAEIAEGLNE